MNEKIFHAPRLINKWLCHKLECFGDFIKSYSINESRFYLEPFAGGGIYTCKGIDCFVDGSEIRALKNGFLKCIYIVNDVKDAGSLKKQTTPIKGENAIIIGNCINESTLHQAFNLIPRSYSSFAFVDPPGYNKLRWSTITKLATHGFDWKGNKTDLLIVFPLEMALLRNLTRMDCEASINRLYGNHNWQEIRQRRLDDKIGYGEARLKLISLYRSGLKNLGYRYVNNLKPARFSNPPIYHLFWASDTHNRLKELTDIWSKPRYLPCELFTNVDVIKYE
jgi:three-Cys-motif partner protein